MHIPHLAPAGVRHVIDHLATFPRPDRAAADAVRAWAAQQGVDIDPNDVDVVTLHYQVGTNAPFEGVVKYRKALPQALLDNWQGESDNDLVGAIFQEPWAGHWPGSIQVVEALPDPEQYSLFNGLFRRSQPQVYDHTTLIDLPAEQFQAFIWALNFSAQYRAMLDRYWNGGFEGYRSSARLNFVAACNRQVAQGSLSVEATGLAWQVAGLRERRQSLQVRPLNIYGYAATDLFYFKSTRRPLTVLFIPGNASPLHEFPSLAHLQDWIAEQCKDLTRRAALISHFSAADAPDGLSYSGLATALEGLALYPQRNHLDANRPGFTREGYWPPREYVNYKADEYSPAIAGDVFEALAQRQKQRSYRDAQQLITSDAQVTKARWLGYISSAVNYLAPLALVVPELAPLFAVGGLAQFGLGLDQAIEGHDLAEKAQGVEGAVFGVLNAAPLAGELAEGSARLFRFKFDNFVMPSSIDGQWGYPLSPLSPPRLPADEIRPFFHDPDPIAPLPDADPDVYANVLRTPTYRGTPDTLTGEIGGYSMGLLYDIDVDAFLMLGSANDVDPAYYRPPQPGMGRNMVRIDVARREVTHATRMRTLRALGVDLQLPVQLPALPLEQASAIPKRVLSLWIGDQLISPALLDNVAHNAARLAETDYRFTLYLSGAKPEAYAENLRQLAERAPRLEVVRLEDQALYHSFRESAYYEQYQAALSGNGKGPAHYASAADVLRYRLLHAEGGLYMDLDDILLAPGEHPAQVAGRGVGRPGEALDTVALATPADGLLLFPPVCNEKMANGNIFNNSLIGSHPGNPTLEAISEEMLARYRQTPGFYDSLPRAANDQMAFDAYARRLSQISGPSLLTEVACSRLPWLHQLRQIASANAMNQRGLRSYLDVAHYREAERQLLPLDRIAKIGANQSWVR